MAMALVALPQALLSLIFLVAVLPLAAAADGGRCPLADLARARERVPRQGWKGRDFAEMAQVLTRQLHGSGHRVRPCGEWVVEELQALQRRLFQEAEGSLLAIYESAGDRRRQRFASLSALEAHWAKVDAAASVAPGELGAVRRDGLCHEAVMWWVHHLPTPVQRRLIAEGLEIPSLPGQRHEQPPAQAVVAGATTAAAAVVHSEYAQQVSCQQCHTGKIVDPDWQDASLPAPLPVDKLHPGRERQRQCDFQSQPPCGPCEGLGGPRWGDGVEDMTPMPCEVIHGPEVNATTRGRYPSLATVSLTGDSRFPLEVRPKQKGKYMKINATLALGWQGDMMRMRYDFGGLGTQISIQTLQQANAQEPGATVSMGESECICSDSIAGNMHVNSFEASDPLDPLQLPADAGGAAYLGRVRVTLDGEGDNRTAIADHFMKWAFHFLVDADEASPTFGLPLRLYGPYGVRQVFRGWKLGDPTKAWPDVWQMRKGCQVKSKSCDVFGAVEETVIV